MIAGSLQFAGKYDYLGERIKSGFQFIAENDLSATAPGTYRIDGDKVYVLIQEYDTVPASELRFEAHRHYLDIQYVISGEESVQVAKTEELEVLEEYNEKKDIVFLKDPTGCSSLLLRTGDYGIFFPEEAHKPKCSAGSAQRIKKAVVKILL